MKSAAVRLAAVFLMLMTIGWFDGTAALARQSMSFSPGSRHYTNAYRAVRHPRSSPHRRAGGGKRRGGRITRSAGRPGRDGDAAAAVPGAGFTMQDGILTYPAPARFQPGHLKRR